MIVILAAAAILIAVTGSANKKAKSDAPNADIPNTENEIVEEESKSSPDKTTTQKITEEIAAEKPGATESKQNEESKADDDAKQDSAEIDIEDEEVASIQNDELPQFSVPVNNFIIKDYSDELPVFSYTMNDYRVHNGVDIACSVGTPVLAAADGFICEVTNDPMMGVTIGIQHSGGAVTRYKGLSEESLNFVKNGDEVKRGQVIGASGDTALIESAEESHVHFELTIDGEHKDPGEYMKMTYLEDVYEG